MEVDNIDDSYQICINTYEEIYVKELAHTVVRVNKSEMCLAGQEATPLELTLQS